MLRKRWSHMRRIFFACKAPGPWSAPCEARPAGSGVGQRLVRWCASACLCVGRSYIAAGTRTGVSKFGIDQALQGLLIGGAALRLPPRGLIAVQPDVGELLQYAVAGLATASCGVDVFHAYQPAPAVRARIQPAGKGRHHRAGVQGPRRRRSEAAHIVHGAACSMCQAAASASSSPEMKASSTRWPRHQSPHSPSDSSAFQTWLKPSGSCVCACSQHTVCA